MNLEQWCNIDERICIADADERYKQYAGLPHSEQVIEQLAGMKNLSARIFLESFSEPRELFLASLESIADSTTKKLELKLFNSRNKKIISSRQRFGGAPVNWSTWRQFNNVEKDSSKRKEVFDQFIARTRHVSPIIRERFSQIAQVYKLHSHGKMSPLDGYLETEKISYSQLVDFVKSMGARAKKPFQQALTEVSKKVLGRDPEYYDDFYFFRNKAYSDLQGKFVDMDPPKQVWRTLERMGFNLSSIRFDNEDRKNKYPSPICFFIQVPTDIRVLYKSESPYFDLQGCYHEMGHAMHAASIKKELDYWNRYGFSMGVAEIFSIFLERLTKNSHYLSSLGLEDRRVLSEIERRNNFMELFFVTFYTANSLMKAEFWHKRLSMEKATRLYASLIKEYTGFDVPGEYWMLHHILPDAIMYVPSYLVAAVRAAELEKHLRDKFGDKWWAEEIAGAYLREIMEPGAKIELSRFSSLDSGLFIREITTTVT